MRKIKEKGDEEDQRKKNRDIKVKEKGDEADQ